MAQSDDGNSGRGGWNKNEKPAYVLRPPPLPGLRPPPVPPGTSQNVAAIKAHLRDQKEREASPEQKSGQTSERQPQSAGRDRADIERTRAALRNSAERLGSAERQNQVSRFVEMENSSARADQSQSAAAEPPKPKSKHPSQSRFLRPANDRNRIDNRRSQLKGASENLKQSRFQQTPTHGRGDEPQR